MSGPPGSDRRRAYLRAGLLGAALILCLPPALRTAAQLGDLQWDFGIYYLAAEAHRQGADPYDTGALSRLAGAPVGLPFVYPLPTLYLFRPFLGLDYPTAALLYLYLKGLLLLGLYFLWQRHFLERPLDLLFFPFSLMALGSPVSLDLRSGNISLLEHFLIWVALAFFLRRKNALFCLFILLAASFKLTPILFLGLLRWSPDPRRLRHGLLAGLVFGGYLVGSFLLDPALFGAFLRNLQGLQEGGRINPSSLAWITDLLGQESPGTAALAVFALLAALVGLLSWEALSLRAAREGPDRERVLCFLFCLAYALILPRFKDYSYLLLVLPIYWILRRWSGAGGDLLLAGFVLFSTPVLFRDGSRSSLLWDYAPLLGAYLAWAGFLYWILRGRDEGGRGGEADA